MKMVMISADEYEKLKNEKKEAVDKLEAYKQCASGYESRIKRLAEELEDSVNEITNLNDLIGSLKSDRTAKNETIKKLEKELDELKSKYSATISKKVLNSVYGTEQDVCCRILNGLNKSMFDKITELSNENEKLKKEIKELNCRIGLFETELLTKNATLGKLEKENKKLIEDNEKLGEKCHKLEVEASSFNAMFSDCGVALKEIIEGYTKKIKELKQKYEAVLKSNEKLAAENQCLTNNPETTKLSNELSELKKQYRDLNNAYKSQKNTLYKLTKSSDDTNDVLRSQYSCLYKDYERVKLAREEAIKEIKSLNEQCDSLHKYYLSTKLTCNEYEDALNKIKSLVSTI